MKSETYQKEGWFILEDESIVLGKKVETIEAVNSNDGFIFYRQNKTEVKNSIVNSADDLTSFVDSITVDILEPSDDEFKSGIDKILEKTHSFNEHSNTHKTDRKKKVTLKVLFIAALLSILSVSCLFVTGSNNNISIENGFITFAKDTVRVAFFDENEEQGQYISVEALLLDLENHGFKEILFPEEVSRNPDKYKLTLPRYFDIGVEQVTFDIIFNEIQCGFTITKEELSGQEHNFFGLKNAKTITVGNISVYILDFKNSINVKFTYNGLSYDISIVSTAYEELLKIVESIK